MNGTKVTINSLKGVSTLVRARFGPGMLLQHEDLEQLNTYTRELSRLLFRSLFGCGVVCGLVVETKTDCGKVVVTVGSGLALGCSGDPIHLPKDQSLLLDEHCDPDLRGPLWVLLCATSKCCSPRPSMCASDEDETSSVCTRERDGFEIRIVSELPKCVCGGPTEYENDFESDCLCADPDHPCYMAHYDGLCKCKDGEEECDCSCDCVVLAQLDKSSTVAEGEWEVDHSVRCFKRPVLMRDPQVEKERQQRSTVTAQRAESAQRAENAQRAESAQRAVANQKPAAKPAKPGRNAKL